MRNPVCELLYEVLIATHRGAVKEVARVAGLAERTVYDHCTDGRLNPSVEVIKAAWVVTRDPRLRKLLEPEGWRLVPEPEAAPRLKDPEAEITDINLAAADAIKALRAALDPQGPGGARITRQETTALHRHLDLIERELAEARQAVKRMEDEKARRPLAVAGR